MFDFPDLGDLGGEIGGFEEGGGLFEAIGNLIESFLSGDGVFSELLSGGGFQEFARMLENMAESGAGRSALAEAFTEGFQVLLDLHYYESLSGFTRKDSNFSKAKFESFRKSHAADLEKFRETAKAHGHLYGALQQHASEGDAKAEALLAEWETLGARLPDNKALKDVRRFLATKTHTDKGGIDGAFVAMTDAIETLQNQKNRSQYEGIYNAMRAQEGGDKGFLNLLHEYGKHATAPKAKPPIALLPKWQLHPDSSWREKFSYRLSHGYAEASTLKKTGIISGTAIGGAVTLYGVLKVVDELMQKPDTPTLATEGEDALPQQQNHKKNAAIYGAVALAGLCSAALSFNQFRLSGGPLR